MTRFNAKDFPKIAGPRLKKLRKARNLTLSELSRKTKNSIKSKDIGLFEKGLQDISAVDLYIICNIIGVPIELIFYGSEEKVQNFINSYCL